MAATSQAANGATWLAEIEAVINPTIRPMAPATPTLIRTDAAFIVRLLASKSIAWCSLAHIKHKSYNSHMDDSKNSSQPDWTDQEPISPTPSLETEEEVSPPQPSAKINLLGHEEPGLVAIAEETVHTDSRPKLSSWRPKLMVALIALVIIVGLGTGSFLLLSKEKSQKPVSPPPKTVPAPPPPVPAAQTVTAPAITPTVDRPQTVIVQSNSGLWLRSTPDSSSRSNIVGWMPKGATVLVDQVGGFWWHGAYKSTAGYFASDYTQ